MPDFPFERQEPLDAPDAVFFGVRTGEADQSNTIPDSGQRAQDEVSDPVVPYNGNLSDMLTKVAQANGRRSATNFGLKRRVVSVAIGPENLKVASKERCEVLS